MDSTVPKWPGDSDEAYPDVFNKPPPFPEKLKPGHLSKEQFYQFFEQGYIVIDNFFKDDMEILEGCKRDIAEEVDQLAKGLYKAGKIKNLYEEYGFYQRLTMMEEEFPGTNVILQKVNRLPENFKKLYSLPRLLNVVEQLLGTANIAGSPAFNLRGKTPSSEADTSVPWHQDNGYFEKRLYDQTVIIGWIPFLDANGQNGCMQVARYGHKTGKTATHKNCWKDKYYIILEEEEMVKTLGVDLENDVVTCPVPYGGIMLFNNVTPHRSLNNRSDEIRWSTDLRWQRSDIYTDYYGKDNIQLRSESDPNFEVNWEPFDGVHRHSLVLAREGLPVEEYDTTHKGPWMKKWELIHSNQHTDAYFKTEKIPVPV